MLCRRSCRLLSPWPETWRLAGSAVSVVTTCGYGGFLLGPVIVGGLTEVFGLRIALGTIAVAGVLMLVLSLRLGRRRAAK